MQESLTDSDFDSFFFFFFLTGTLSNKFEDHAPRQADSAIHKVLLQRETL